MPRGAVCTWAVCTRFLFKQQLPRLRSRNHGSTFSKPVPAISCPWNPMGQELANSARSKTNTKDSDEATAPDPQAVAVDVVTDMGKNSIIWDSCRLIYDTAELVNNEAKPDEIAVFGIKGNVRTVDQSERTFAVRHGFEFHGSGRYALTLSMPGTPDLVRRVYLREPQADGGLSYFQDVVLRLTAHYEKHGVEDTMKSFLHAH